MAAGQLVSQVLSLNDIDEVYSFAERNLADAMSDEVERRFYSWSAKWRRESLEHYLKQGASFIVREKKTDSPSEKGETMGFFLAQPVLYFRGQNQTLWVEYVEAKRPDVLELLVELAVRNAREKHVQRVLFAEPETLRLSLTKWNAQRLSDDIAEIKTTKG